MRSRDEITTKTWGHFGAFPLAVYDGELGHGAIVHVDGDQPMSRNVGDRSGFRVYPFALMNPIWIDADGDGKITPRSP